MPLSGDITILCPQLRTGPGRVCVTMPGGGEICVSADPNLPDAASATKKMFDAANGALAPLVPIFNILDAIFAIKDCIEAIPKSLVPPNPKPMLECLVELLKKIGILSKILPYVSVPAMIVGLIDAIIGFLEGYLAEVRRMIARVEAIARARTRAEELGNVQLIAVLDCAEQNVKLELENLNQSAEPLNRLIGVLNGFADLAGLPCIPSIDGLTELSDEALKPIEDVIEFLIALRDSIPVPDFLLQPSFSKPCDTRSGQS